MKKFALSFLALIFALNIFAADTGGVSEAIQRWAGKKVFLDRALVDSTLTGNTTLYVDSKAVQRMDPGGSSRNVTLPAVADCEGYEFFIINSADAAENLVVKNVGATTICTIGQNEAGFVFCNGGSWYGFVFSNASTGFLPASGATVGATGAAQDFGANGVKADNFISSAGTTTNFNFKLTDNLADAMNIKEGSNSYMKFITTNSGEKIQISKPIDYPAAQTVTILDNNAAALDFTESTNSYMKFVTTDSGEKTVFGKKVDLGTQIVERTGQRICYGLGGAKVGGTAGFVVGAASNIFAATCPASQTGAKLIIPIGGLKAGSVITAFGLCGQIESGGNAVTVDCDLRVSTAAAADFTDASVSTMTQISVTADTKIDSTQDKTGLTQTVAQDESYYMVVTVTTNGSTDVDIRGARLVIKEQ